MKVTTLITWSMITGEVLAHDYHEYSGTWELCKGEQEQANKIAQQQLQLQQQAFDLQKQQIGAVNNIASPYVTGQGQGYTPEQMALLNSSSANNLNSAYNSATKNVRSYLGAQGEGLGNLPVGGSFVPSFAALEGGRASDLANAYRTNQLANIQQALSNKFNAASLMAGQSPVYAGNVSAFGNQGTSALNTANSAYGQSFGGNFYPALGALSGKLGVTAGAGLLGGWLAHNTLNNLYNNGGVSLTGDLGTNASMIAGLSSLTGSGTSGMGDLFSGASAPFGGAIPF